MSSKVLCVDDDARILKGIQRQLGDRFDLRTTTMPREALEILTVEGPFAVVVSDMRMPEMTGLELLMQTRSRCPDTVRMMLTGHADLQTTIDAVNEGNIFRFLAKPSSAEVLGRTIEAGVRQYELVTAERELVEGTLKGSVKVLSEMLSLVSPVAFGRASRLQRTVCRVGEALGVSNLWELEIAGMLSQLGCVTIPDAIVEKVSQGRPLQEAELEIYQRHPAVAGTLLSNIPRLQPIAEIIKYQAKGFDGSGSPRNETKGTALPIGARILKAVLDLDTEMLNTSDATEAMWKLKTRSERYDPAVLAALEPIVVSDCGVAVFSMRLSEVKEGMVFAADVVSSRGQVLVSKGQEVSATLRMKLLNFVGQICEPISVSYLHDVPTTSNTAPSGVKNETCEVHSAPCR